MTTRRETSWSRPSISGSERRRDRISVVQSGVTEAAAAGQVLSGNFKQAAATYATLVASRPDDARLRLSYGEALLGDQQFAAACSEFEQLKGKGLGPRDLGLPAARACMQKGDPDAAIAWLKTIPTRFLPPSVQNEAVFASLREREDFKALSPRAERVAIKGSELLKRRCIGFEQLVPTP